jgi:DNA-binding winged helix-turn-helix (wHTH) protein/Tfp pilus assembly protein PilF
MDMAPAGLITAASLAQLSEFMVGDALVCPATRTISGPGGNAQVEPRVMQVLVVLAEAKGGVVTRDTLLTRCWGGFYAGDDSLNRAVAGVRRVASGVAGGSFEIETIPRTGYRLIAEPRHAKAAGPISRRYLIAAGASSLLVLSGAELWGERRSDRAAEAQRLIDRGDILLRDAVPLQAGEASPPLRSALEIDPTNAKALGLLALAEETQANNGGSADPGETLRGAERAARKALEHDPNEPHARLAMIDIKAGSLDWSQMEDRLNAVRASAPNNAHVLGALTSFLQAAGRTSRSWVYNEQAAAVAPTSPTPQWRRVLRLWTAGRTEQALSLSERLLPLWPTHALVWNARFMILAFTGRTEAATAMLRDAAGPRGNAHPARPEQWVPTLDAFADPSPMRVAKAREANLAAAQLNPGQATYAAMALSQLGEVDAAFEVIDALLLSKGPLVSNRPIAPRSFVANSPSWCRTQWLFMPPLAAARSDARFAALCEEIGLARYWRQRGVGPDILIPS